MDITSLVQIIKNGKFKEVISRLRNTKDKKARNTIKTSNIPAVTLSGIFSERRGTGLICHSGLMQIDIDDLSDYFEAFRKLKADPYTYVCFRSPGGEGIKAIVKILPSDSSHREQFLALEGYYRDTHNITIDPSCKDITRCMLLSYDPDIYVNERAQVFTKRKEASKSANRKVAYASNVITPGSPETRAKIQELTKKIENDGLDLTDSYDNWMRIGFALHTELGEEGREYFHRISQFHHDYNESSCENFYTELGLRNNGSITAGSLFHIAGEQGIKINHEHDKQPIDASAPAIAAEPDPAYETPDLKEELRKLRDTLRKEQDCLAFQIYSNKILDAIADSRPASKAELISIKGISEKKADAFGDRILEIMRQCRPK
ncbi:BT4734/BF3469 family protein [Robertkochia sediminum]|uniref:BT4734/BF3469 family protein n=1 Tax=Robertkochia sediminum TaxID=2785326 RepID=UPI0019311A07|nr:BT4734/BF3469 family protein [Robertkochia sediminum]MBL7471380.1 HRDC domain-containing protein [Robertkochia sediminum]